MSEQEDPFARAVTVLGLARTPLSVVLRSLDDLQGQDPASPAALGQIERVRQQAEQVLRLIVTMDPPARATRGAALPLPLPVPLGGRVRFADQVFLKRVAAAIDAGMEDEAFGVEALAAEVAVGRSHLYRRLEALLGCSPARLILERRLEQAARLLAGRAGNVSEVAFRVGFKNLSHFSQRFRERFGTTPSAYAGGGVASAG
jgi:AraC-like DNA-binding protein